MSPPQPVRLSVPAESRYVRLARLAAAGVATEAGFDVDGVEDLRVAVNELFALLVDDAEDPAGVVELTFGVDGDMVSVDGQRSLDAPAPDVDDLALEILRVVVDDHRFDADDSERRFHLRKRATPAR
jgi:anti-sigma regulatory factor (Ser/Thr protein kinase)